MNDSPVEFQTLIARVEKLESQSRRWKLASAVLSLFGAGFLLMGAKPADRFDKQVIRASTVEAQEFLLKDEDGHVYARFSLTPGLPIRFLAPGAGSPRFYTAPGQAVPGQASLQFFDDKGNVVWTAPSRPELMTVR
jgi:hypothetical protein